MLAATIIIAAIMLSSLRLKKTEEKIAVIKKDIANHNCPIIYDNATCIFLFSNIKLAMGDNPINVIYGNKKIILKPLKNKLKTDTTI